jgi:cyclophilin family peptidyl-prolyl cis-trans isomerase
MALAALLLAGCVSSPVPGPAPSPAEGGVSFEGARFDTAMGRFTVMLYPDDAPETVALYRTYLQDHYFDGRAFGRVVPGHVIQVTDAGGAGATEDKRTVPLEASPRLNFSAGAVGIARGEDPHSGGAEFFVMDYATSHLWGNFTVFAQVVEGLDVVRAIARVPALAPPPSPASAALPFDRLALDPVDISAAELVNVTLPAPRAAQLPPRVGLNVREGDLRHSLEWPADLAPARASELVWYLRPYNGTAAPSAAQLALRITGPGGEDAPALRPDGAYPEVLRFTWTPRAAGPHEATLSQAGRALATIVVEVPAP